jgi:hypothetical protein
MMKRKKYRKLSDIYKQTRTNISAAPAGSEEPRDMGSPPLDSIFRDENPTLSPPRVETAATTNTKPTSSSSSSSDEDLNEILSESKANRVEELQQKIESKVDSLITSEGYEEKISQENRNKLGEWVHGETTNVKTLEAIHNDLEKHGDKSSDFVEALKALVDQFLN